MEKASLAVAWSDPLKNRWAGLWELASGPDGAATAQAVRGALEAGVEPGQRRGFIVSPLDACPAPNPPCWPEGDLARCSSLSLLDLACFSDQPGVVEACFAFAPARRWGATALSTFAGLCAERGALESLNRLLDEPAVAPLVLARLADAPRGGSALLSALLSVGFLGSAAGLECLSRLRCGAGEESFKKWLALRGQDQWQGVLVERAWCSGLSTPMLGPWRKQVERLSTAGAERWAYAMDSARLAASFGKLDTFEREARVATGPMAPWGAYMRGAIIAAGFEGRPVDAKEARELAAVIRASSSVFMGTGEEASARLEALAEKSELGDELAGSRPEKKAASKGSAGRL